MLFNSTFCLHPCSARELRNAWADPALLEIPEMFSLCFDFYFFPVGFHKVSHNFNYLETISESGPPCFLAGLHSILLILH